MHHQNLPLLKLPSKTTNAQAYLALPQSAAHSICRKSALEGLDDDARCRHLSEQTGVEMRGGQEDTSSDEKKSSAVSLGERMEEEEDSGMELKIVRSDGEAASPATAAASKPSSINKKRLLGRVDTTSHNHEMIDDYYSSTNSNSEVNSDEKHDCGQGMQRHKAMRQE